MNILVLDCPDCHWDLILEKELEHDMWSYRCEKCKIIVLHPLIKAELNKKVW